MLNELLSEETIELKLTNLKKKKKNHLLKKNWNVRSLGNERVTWDV